MPRTAPADVIDDVGTRNCLVDTAVSNKTAAGEEIAAFLENRGCQLYHVIHTVGQPKATALLAGPFPSERLFSLIPWTRWARHLARNGIEVLRFDYRAAGESTGDFAHYSFPDWLQDINMFAELLKNRHPDLPLLLHGLGLGALLSANLFETGIGDALLLWSPPADGQAVLREALLRKISAEYGIPNREDPVAPLQRGESIQVEGYTWSPRLWNDAAKIKLPGNASDTRPRRSIKLDRRAAPLVPGFGQAQALNPGDQIAKIPLSPPLTELFQENFNWVNESLRIPAAA